MAKTSKKDSKKTVKITFNNPDMDVNKRPHLAKTELKFKAMIELAWEKFCADKNSELKYCSDCHIIAETRAGSELHFRCKNVFTSKQLKGLISHI